MSDTQKPVSSLELRSKAVPEGRLELSLERVIVDDPGPGEVVVRVEAAPINPTDLGMLLGAAEPMVGKAEGEGENRRLVIPLSEDQRIAFKRRMNLSLCPGLEGAGTVVDAGPGGHYLLGRTVAMFGGSLFAQYRKISIGDCLIPPEGTPPSKVAASFVNPLTVLGMLDTLRREGHKALVHTVGASSVGQMLNRACIQDRIELINVVRRPEHAQRLRDLGARYICESSSSNFNEELSGMIRATGATLAFDAIGGSTMASTVIEAMEEVYAPISYSTYGSSIMKQVYVYGRLNSKTIEVRGGAGMAWAVSGWLMMNYLAKLDAYTVQRMKDRILQEFDTTFSSCFTTTISLDDLLDPSLLERCSHHSTGNKYLLAPHLKPQSVSR